MTPPGADGPSNARGASMRELIQSSCVALGFTHDALATRLGTSRRTIVRWGSDDATPTKSQLEELARIVFPADAELAAQVARAAGSTLEGLRLGDDAAPRALTLGTQHMADLIVCAGAEALDVSPRAMRPAAAAMIARMRELGITVDAAHAVLTPAKKAKAGG
jgi:hypothetical protein